MSSPQVIAVIHLKSGELALKNAELAFQYGCDGVFLIDMNNHSDINVIAQAKYVKQYFPDKLVGVNLLNTLPDDAVFKSTRAGLDMTWTDKQLTHSTNRMDSYVDAIKVYTRRDKYQKHIVFVGVAFKYQEPEPNPITAAVRASVMYLIPTTSGPATGECVDLHFIKTLREGIGPEHRLAIASGITPENFHDYAPYVSHILISTGISDSFYEFSEEKLKRLQEVRGNLS